MNAVARRLLLIFLLAIMFASMNQLKADSFEPDEDVLQNFLDLNQFISGVPDEVLNRGQRNSFISKTAAAESSYRRGKVCTAENQMNAYLNSAQALRKSGRVSIAEDLYNRGRSLRDSFFDVFITDPSSEPPSCFDPDLKKLPQVTILHSDNQRFHASISFGEMKMWSVEVGGETFTQVEVPGLVSVGGEPGLPSIPNWAALVAVPLGAQASLSMSAPPVIRESVLLNLYPYQREAVDQELTPIDPDFANGPFERNEEVYVANAFFPLEPCSIAPMGQLRDLQVWQVSCAAAQYNPVTDEFTSFDSLSPVISFDGDGSGTGNFSTTQSFSGFEPASSAVVSSVLNQATVAEFVEELDISDLICLGEELLILTHSNFRTAADDLAQWKRDKGIITTVINVGAGTAFATASQIDALIESRYDNCRVRPSYVAIIGDVEFVPPARTDYDIPADATAGSDWGYALYPQSLFDVFFPDFGVARIPVDTLAEAQRVVDKIIRYESNPPFIDFGSGAPFYTTASLASQFQCCRMNQNGSPLGGQNGRTQRSFIETVEIARNALMASGKTGERIYMETIDGGGYCLVQPGPGGCPANQVQQPYAGNATPNRYYNGNLLPTDLRASSGFLWNGSTQDIVDAFNGGRFLVIHRDHGSSSGFANPSFLTSDLFRLNNNELLPVVYSVNCSSGYFDRETDSLGMSESFMEQLLLEQDGGMVGGLGDNRDSPTWANSALTRGFVDATWPNVAPEFGGAGSKRRLADILNHGKIYMMTQVGVPQTAGSVSATAAIAENIMWHAFGDPTLEMWTSNPYAAVLGLAHKLDIFPTFLRVFYKEEGAVVTATQRLPDREIPIGRALVTGGIADLEFFIPPEAGVPIHLTASRPGSVSVVLTSTTGGLPDLVVQDLILSSTTFNPGDDLSALLGVKVGNLGGAVADGTVNNDGSIKPGYSIDLVLSSDTAMPLGFATVPPPAGIAYVEDGLLQGGRISRTPDVPAATDLELSSAPPISSDIGGIIPLQVPAGEINLCARIDPGDAVTESDESNNVFCRLVTIMR